MSYQGTICNNLLKAKTVESLERRFKFWAERHIKELAEGVENRLEELRKDPNLKVLTLTIVGDSQEEEVYDPEWMYKEVEVTCEEDQWYNIEVRHRVYQRELKRQKKKEETQTSS